MTRSGPETALVGKIRKAIRAQYPAAFVVKLAGGPYQNAGLPDLLVIVEGRAVGLEVKCQRPGETPEHARERATLRQLACLDEMGRAGAETAVVVSPDEALRAIQRAVSN